MMDAILVSSDKDLAESMDRLLNREREGPSDSIWKVHQCVDFAALEKTLSQQNAEIVVSPLVDDIRRWTEEFPDTAFFFLDEEPSLQRGIDAMQEGAVHYMAAGTEELPLKVNDVVDGIHKGMTYFDELLHSRTVDAAYHEELERLFTEHTRQLVDYSDRLMTTAEGTKILANCTTFPELSARALDILARGLEATAGGLFLLDKGKWTLVYAEDPDQVFSFEVDAGQIDEDLNALFQSSSVVAGVVPNDMPGCMIPFLRKPFGALSLLALESPSRTTEGILVLHRSSGFPFGERDREIGRIILAHAVEALKSIRLTDSLRESDARFQRIAWNVPGVVFQVLCEKGSLIRFTYVSEGSERVTDQSSKTLMRDPQVFLERLNPDDRDYFARTLKKSMDSLTPWRWEGRYRMLAGDTRWFQLEAKPVQQPSGSLVYDGLLLDITERKEMELHLQLADRMVSVGTLAAGVAHEINNPLTYVIANIGLLREEFEEGQLPLPPEERDDVITLLNEAEEGAHRVTRIVRDLKVFSRGDERQLGSVNLQSVLDSSINMAMNEIRHRAQLDRDYKDVPAVMANDSRLGQVFLNLLINAAQAIPEGDAGHHTIRVATYCDEENNAIVEVSDTGMGIHSSELKRIFDPFFTTKPVGVGTGLGLPICHRIITEFGGQISVESTVDEGTIFRVTMPAMEVAETFTKPLVSGTLPSAGRAKVLIVDDEPGVTSALKRALREHVVTAVHSGRQAIDALRIDPQMDLVLCDLMMPDMSGMDVFDAVRQEWPGLEQNIVFMTGGAFTTKAWGFLEDIENMHLEKPFDMKRVRKVVKRFLGKRH
ncbi:MAG: response regulator [Deltaproteobacteria bacterium]|nr:response regulator [Deltaproteobacteria bacterium]